MPVSAANRITQRRKKLPHALPEWQTPEAQKRKGLPG
jgi:hypothetical protein